MTRLRWLLAHVLREHLHAPAVMIVGVSLLMLARGCSISL